MRRVHRGANGRRRVRLARGKHRKIEPAAFENLLARLTNIFQLRVAQADLDTSAQHGYGGRHYARIPQDLLALTPGLKVRRMGQAAGHHDRFKGDNGLALPQRLLYLLRDIQKISVHP